MAMSINLIGRGGVTKAICDYQSRRLNLSKFSWSDQYAPLPLMTAGMVSSRISRSNKNVLFSA